MAPDLQKYYEDFFSLTAQPGWAPLMEDFSNLKEQINNVLTTKDAQHLFFRLPFRHQLQKLHTKSYPFFFISLCSLFSNNFE